MKARASGGLAQKATSSATSRWGCRGARCRDHLHRAGRPGGGAVQHRLGAALFGYTKLYGSVPGAQAEYLRVPQAHFGPVKVPERPPDERFLYLSDVLPTAWQAVDYADIPADGTVAVYGLGPIGQMCMRVARYRGASLVVGVDPVPERLEMARRHGVEALNRRSTTASRRSSRSSPRAAAPTP